MRDLYLRFNDADKMRTQLIAAGFKDDEGQGGLYHPDISLDIVGVITVPAEVINPGEENEVIKYTTEPGYHVNLRVMNDSLDLSGLNDFVVKPTTPARVWA
ncbi:hypothetical protein [Leclercia adecarboxylata]|uniref:hypothetical protein n=1 Tax=Leclercia adecarboxylata TaxID=83655 RepID=UPI00294A57A6|nr:hypothetical protein [Leclercia adecarboxylata]MDV5239910.1 hypothetical protein [Leclercia adecarboxylata]MDV5275507.1 hypothetical protein [Leclercia adecarboxylata]MDV5276472.1 hypothetical protein [Leclercia adecarboxylata]MDV5460943.1 hypothetical protein [Leclercia adecarboxylata]MDV5503910.1 hypothetical protein [Leclercia adecarboxylata]